MDVEQLRQGVVDGTVSLDRLLDLIASQQKLIEKLQKQCVELQEKIDSKNPTERLDEQYSEKAKEKTPSERQKTQTVQATPKGTNLHRRKNRQSRADGISLSRRLRSPGLQAVSHTRGVAVGGR